MPDTAYNDQTDVYNYTITYIKILSGTNKLQNSTEKKTETCHTRNVTAFPPDRLTLQPEIGLSRSMSLLYPCYLNCLILGAVDGRSTIRMGSL